MMEAPHSRESYPASRRTSGLLAILIGGGVVATLALVIAENGYGSQLALYSPVIAAAGINAAYWATRTLTSLRSTAIPRFRKTGAGVTTLGWLLLILTVVLGSAVAPATGLVGAVLICIGMACAFRDDPRIRRPNPRT